MGVIINSVTFEEAQNKMLSLNWGIFLQGISRLKVTVSARATGNTRLRRFSALIEGTSYPKNMSGTSSSDYVITNILKTSGTRNARISVMGIGSSGTVGDTAYYPYTVVSYTQPAITEATAKRVNASNVEDENGTYLNITFKGTIDSVGNRNKNIFKIGYKEKGSADDYTYKVLVNDDKTTYTLNYENYRFTDITLDTTKNYEIAFFAVDEFYSKDTARDILLGFDLLNFNPSGKSMAIGTISTRGANEECLDIALDTYINGDRVYPNIYSTNEVAIGTWTHGEPLYRRCFDGYLNANGTLDNDIQVGGTIYKIDGYVRSVYNNTWKIGSHYFPEPQYDTCFTIDARTTDYSFNIETNGNFSNGYYYVIVEYTK